MQSSRHTLEAIDKQALVVEMYLEGATTVEIAKALDTTVGAIHKIVARARIRLLADKNEYFSTRLVALLDQKIEALIEQAGLFADTEWLNTTKPERIRAIGLTFGILWDKTAVLLAAAGRHQRATLGDAVNGNGNGRAGDYSPGTSQTD